MLCQTSKTDKQTIQLLKLHHQNRFMVLSLELLLIQQLLIWIYLQYSRRPFQILLYVSSLLVRVCKHYNVSTLYVTRYEKTDHLQFFINVVYPVSSMCAECIVFKKKIFITSWVTNIYVHSGSATTFPENGNFVECKDLVFFFTLMLRMDHN